ncbi:MAG: hypothetical protein U9M98_01620 [Patescibacteria group bacterium]|nr:hypothetical protein [Patescibacteria group bacterium]
MSEERHIFEETVNEEIERLLDVHLAEEGIYRLRENLKLIVEVMLRIPPEPVRELNTLARAYVQGNKSQDELINALETFLAKIPPEAVSLLTEQRDGTGTLMSNLRKKVEEKRRFVKTQGKVYR